MVSFSLQAKNDKRKKALKVIGQLKHAFGKDSVEITDYESWISIEMSDDYMKGWVDANEFKEMCVYNPYLSNRVTIPLDLIEMIYML